MTQRWPTTPRYRAPIDRWAATRPRTPATITDVTGAEHRNRGEDLCAGAGNPERQRNSTRSNHYLRLPGRARTAHAHRRPASLVNAPAIQGDAATRTQTPPRRSFTVAAPTSTPKRLLDDLSFSGFLSESLVARDLRVLSSPLRGTVAHYRDSNGVEVDVILHIPDGTWGAFEVKFGPGRIDDAAASLLRFASTIHTEKAGEPAVLGVVTTATYGCTRKDGIQVIPVAALRP